VRPVKVVEMVQSLGVVVGIDESEQSGQALDWAAAQAVARSGILTICHVLRPTSVPDLPLSPGLPIEPSDHGDCLVEQAAWRARRADRRLAVQTRVERGSVAGQLLRLAAAAEELVVGSHGSGGFALLGLGSVGGHLIGHAVCPVTVVRGGRTSAREVLVGIDGSERGEAALDYAFWYADCHRMSVHALHAYAVAVPAMPYPTGIDAGAARSTARQLTAETVEPWTLKYPTVPVRQTVVAGHSASSLVAASIGSALLVVGGRGHGTFASLLLGSVSQAVLRHTHCPVTVAR
jgi:nucleotide-binding universal stress UspA family protein